MSRTRPSTRKYLACLALALATALPAVAQESTEENQDNNPAAKLSVHGFLTQAYGKTDKLQYFGIPHDGTSDLRKAALQFRYDGTSQDSFVLQLAHERWGRSPFGPLHQDVELDWAFYQHTFSDDTAVKAGKLTVPFGFYNQIRDVGVLLPFYRLPQMYSEGLIVLETVNGVSVARPVVLGDWEVDGTLYYGESGDRLGTVTRRLRMDKVSGAQLWLVTPFQGIRAGAAGWRGKSDVSFLAPPTGPNRGEVLKARMFSLEGTFGPLRLVGEHNTYSMEELKSETFYGQAFLSLTDKLKLNGQYQHVRLSIQRFNQGAAATRRPDYDKDWALSATYAFRPDVVLRLEQHRYQGFRIETPGTTSTFVNTPQKVNYTVLSLSTSF